MYVIKILWLQKKSEDFLFFLGILKKISIINELYRLIIASMTTVQLDIPDNLKMKVWLKPWNHIDIIDLFNMFWIDINYVIGERKYAQDFLDDIKNKQFVVSNHF